MPIANPGPTPRYRPKDASSRVSSAAITVSAENVTDSPTRSTEATMASRGANPRPRFSRYRKMRNSP